METSREFLRFAGPNERRTISRENLGFYNAVIVGAVYELGEGIDPGKPETFFYPLKHCVESHPWLCAVVADAHTDKAFYQRVATIDLASHVEIAQDAAAAAAADDLLGAVERLMARDLNRPLPPGIPPWKIVVLPLGPSQCFVSFVYSHSILDGPSGCSFHHSLLEGLSDPAMLSSDKKTEAAVVTPPTPLPEPFDTPTRLPISWSFLLGPLVALILPRFISNILGLQAQASPTDEGTWTGTPMFFHPETSRSKIRVRQVDSPTLDRAIRLAREHDAKLTATVQKLMTRAMFRALGDDAPFTNMVALAAVSMRASCGVPSLEMGEFASACYSTYSRDGSTGGALTESDWDAAREATRRLAETASTLQDQPIGLLRYLPSIRKWTLGKIGKHRDCSLEVSNVGAFSSRSGNESQARISQAAFAQPGHVDGPPMTLNLVSVPGSGLVYTVTWQVGALGIDRDEDEFMDQVCDFFESGFAQLA